MIIILLVFQMLFWNGIAYADSCPCEEQPPVACCHSGQEEGDKLPGGESDCHDCLCCLTHPATGENTEPLPLLPATWPAEMQAPALRMVDLLPVHAPRLDIPLLDSRKCVAALRPSRPALSSWLI